MVIVQRRKREGEYYAAQKAEEPHSRRSSAGPRGSRVMLVCFSRTHLRGGSLDDLVYEIEFVIDVERDDLLVFRGFAAAEQNEPEL